MATPAVKTPTIESGKRVTDIGIDEVSPLLLVCMLVACHCGVNGLLLTPYNGRRCLFWNRDSCTEDEDWITNWFSFAHCHVAALYAAMIYVATKFAPVQTTVAYTGAFIMLVYTIEGLFSVHIIHESLAMLQVSLYGVFLLVIARYTNQMENTRPASIFLPRKLTTSSYDRRGKVSITQVAVGAQIVSTVLRVHSMSFGDAPSQDGATAYLGDRSSLAYQNISSMALCDMFLVAVLLGIGLRFFEAEDLKPLLWMQAFMLFVSQLMLAGDQGNMISADELRAGGLGTLISIVVSLFGALR